jgi:hypothetical protein
MQEEGPGIGAWGVAQWPYLLPETLSVDQAADESTTLTWVVVAFCIAALLVLPCLALLLWLDQHSRLEERGREPRRACRLGSPVGPWGDAEAGSDGRTLGVGTDHGGGMADDPFIADRVSDGAGLRRDERGTSGH